jgi:hypothetical protein
MYNSLSDPYLIAQYHQEYLELINRFGNHKRSSSFIRYYNINYDESTKHPDIASTFDLYDSNSIKFDIYELTPTFNISPIVSATSNVIDKKGQMFDSVTTITIFTIELPRINDLVTFYDPVKSGEIFRVNNIRTSINAYYSDPKLTWYEMDLEVAPIRDTSLLKISKHYVYDSHKEKYYNYEDYTEKTNLINTINGEIQVINQYYSAYNDFYRVDNLVPYIANQAIIYFKDRISLNDNSIRLFDPLVKPYGFLDRFPDLAATYNFQESTLQLYNLDTDLIEDYIWDREVTNDLNTLLSSAQNLYNSVNYNQNYF